MRPTMPGASVDTTQQKIVAQKQKPAKLASQPAGFSLDERTRPVVRIVVAHNAPGKPQSDNMQRAGKSPICLNKRVNFRLVSRRERLSSFHSPQLFNQRKYCQAAYFSYKTTL